VIVVDNASTDGAPEVVAADFPRVRLIRNAENVGYARACNQAARAARGRYLFFLNNDTVIPRGALRRLVERARATPGLGLLGPRLRDGKGRVQRSVRARPCVSALCHRVTFLRWTGLFRTAHDGFRGEERRDQPHPAEVLMGAALLMPRRVWGQVGGWSEAYTFGGEDIDLCLRVADAGLAVVHDPTTAIVHLGRVASRRHPGYALGKTLVGHTRSLRTAGSAGWAIAAYKLAFTLDVPLRLAVLSGRWLLGRLRGRERSSQRAWLDLVGLTRFVRDDLLAFWGA
jgi:N-acetylglucosaminyl-diphospho-decaprenol L-rhamnosyltransferase